MSEQAEAGGLPADKIRQELGRLPDGASVLVLGSLPPGLPLPDGLRLRRIRHARGAGDLDNCGRHDLALILEIAPSSDMDSTVQLLGRIRDLHASRALVWQGCVPALGQNEMLALGFECHRFADSADPVYLYEADRYNERREWNSPENWANPENFDRYRW